ncbi:MAG: hypothetical protein VW840_03700 [Gammaproteobacteria bacterium]
MTRIFGTVWLTLAAIMLLIHSHAYGVTYDKLGKRSTGQSEISISIVDLPQSVADSSVAESPIAQNLMKDLQSNGDAQFDVCLDSDSTLTLGTSEETNQVSLNTVSGGSVDMAVVITRKKTSAGVGTGCDNNYDVSLASVSGADALMNGEVTVGRINLLVTPE